MERKCKKEENEGKERQKEIKQRRGEVGNGGKEETMMKEEKRKKTGRWKMKCKQIGGRIWKENTGKKEIKERNNWEMKDEGRGKGRKLEGER